MRVLVHLDHGRSLQSWSKMHRDGFVVDESPYGYEYAREYCELRYSEDVAEGRFVRFIRRGAAYCLGFDVIHAFRNRRKLRDCDVVWTHTEHEHLAIALLQRVRLAPPVPVIAQTVWLWDSWAEYRPVRRRLLRWLLASAAVHTTHSPVNAEVARAVLRTAVHVVPFGVEKAIADLPSGSNDGVNVPIDMVAPGNDRHRDWEALASVVAASEHLRCVILSRRDAARKVQRADGRIQVRQSSQVVETVALIRAARVVVVPLKHNSHASGFTVALEALTLGRPVVLSRTGGLDFYFDGIAEWAEVGDHSSLATALHGVLADRDTEDARRSRKEWVLDHGLTTKDYALRHVLISRALLAGEVIPAGVSALAPIDVAR